MSLFPRPSTHKEMPRTVSSCPRHWGKSERRQLRVQRRSVTTHVWLARAHKKMAV
jgi:hypothetical protein